MNAPTPNPAPAPAPVRCARCDRWGLHANGPQCLHCAAYLPWPGTPAGATPHAVAPAPAMDSAPAPASRGPAQGWPPQPYAPGWPAAANYPAHYPAYPAHYPAPVRPAARRGRRPRWARLLGSLALVVILKVFSAFELQLTVMSSEGKLWALLDLFVQVFSDGLLLLTLVMAFVWGIAWLVKAVRGR